MYIKTRDASTFIHHITETEWGRLLNNIQANGEVKPEEAFYFLSCHGHSDMIRELFDDSYIEKFGLSLYNSYDIILRNIGKNDIDNAVQEYYKIVEMYNESDEYDDESDECVYEDDEVEVEDD